MSLRNPEELCSQPLYTESVGLDFMFNTVELLVSVGS